MYIIEHTSSTAKNLNYIEIQNKEKESYAKIYLDLGGSLQELVLKNQTVIKEITNLSYTDTYASSILFPFANRIKDGKYEFKGKTYQFDINEKTLNNAIHGLVYNKTFEVVDKKTTETYASVKLVYHEEKISNGFPYTYAIYLEYILGQRTLDVKIKIENTDSKTFPFTIGWHPYFFSKDLFNSSIVFDSNLKVKLDNRNITDIIVSNKEGNGFTVNNRDLDDCFVLDSNKVLFTTPNYNLTLKSSEKDNFLQLYTPPVENIIAIEPTTGVSDSFNNGLGLKELEPNDIYSVSWNLEIDDF
ncbi:aldose 1-epimerase [Hyunsoonleella jejuensis]|uniref:Aldose 1-epimerase n=1 Tax=Hyunsoonleella jejuensis TaxID=419940 RepID=A0A1H9IMK5_9FLAO|nr:aldose 1-epimerase [Hyunsoonleella jejuensis]SEQ75843.1 aldose 1-epimerase [Hyunsoonleella jejuensis]